VRETVTGLLGIAGLVLIVGGVLGYVLFDRLVKPIVTLTDMVARIDLNTQIEGPIQKTTPTFSDKLIEIDLRADDEVQQLTAAFNAMIRQLRQSFETLEERVARRTAELAAVNKDLEAFSYSVSHDLRAPLRAITGFAAILARRHRANLNDEGQHYLDNIVQAGERMGQLIDDLLAYARLGRAGIRRGPVALHDILTPLAEEFAGRVKEIGGTLEIADDLPTVMGDKTLLTQIFTNLLDNALTYRRADVSVQVTVTHQAEDKAVIVRVSDNGIGIAPEYQEKIFDIFQRLHSQEEYSGAGIGLATVKKSVEMLGGRLWVESEVGKGSAFFVRLPKE
jgi:signal transduction histidine kinase